MIKILLLLLAIFLSSQVSSQTFEASITAGVGTYRMKDLKAFTSAYQTSLPFEPELMADYPPYFYYEPAVTFSFGRFSAGIQASYNSTGSRLSLKDYSGEYRNDSKIRCISPGIYADFSILPIFHKCNLLVYCEPGMIFSRLKLQEVLTLNEEELINTTSVLKSKNFYAEPGIKFSYEISSLISVEFNAGYLIQFGKGHLKSKEGVVIYNDTRPVGPDWSGIRTGLSLVISFLNRHDR